MFNTIRLETVPGPFAGFAVHAVGSENNFDEARQGSVPGSLTSVAQPQGEFYTDLCFINIGATPRYTRRKVGVTGQGSDDADCSTAVLCSEPNPAAAGYSASDTAANNFDVMFAVEQPTREVGGQRGGPLRRGIRYKYTYTEPNGPGSLVSDTYEGVRVVFITAAGKKKSVDVYKTGLISMNASDNGDGCGS